MTMNFNNKVEDLKKEYFASARNGEQPEKVEANYNEYMSAYAEQLKEDIMNQAREERNDSSIRLSRGENILTNEERTFFKNLVADDADLDTYKEHAALPETTVVRVFEDMKSERPLLSKIKFNVAGLRTRMIVGDPDGAAMWGEIFGKIQGQINANFNEYSFSQNKLTAFAIVPKDLIEFGYEWVERYVREQLAEAIGAKLEEGIVVGKGQQANEPIGLLKDVSKDDDGNITNVSDKSSKGTLTFANQKATAKELAEVMSGLSVKENGKRVNVAGRVSLLVNVAEVFTIGAQYTYQNVNGEWVTTLPYNLDVVASEFVPEGKVVAFVGDRYHAAYSGNVDIKAYDQTLALEDADVFIAKQFAHGIPEDNNTAHVYDLDLDASDDSSEEEV